MIVSFTQAIRIIEESGGSLSRQALYNWKAENPLPSFFVEINGKLKIDLNNSEWKRRVENPGHNKKRKSISDGMVSGDHDSIKHEPIPPRIPEIPVTPEILDLEERARIAALNDTIYAAKIKEEKSKQEEIKTSELKKDLAPTYLVKHFFTFAENMIQLVYTRPHEIMPEIKALILAGHDKQAEEKFIRELEGIVVQCQKDLIEAIKEEGYRP
jgi:hypothetical protein